MVRAPGTARRWWPIAVRTTISLHERGKEALETPPFPKEANFKYWQEARVRGADSGAGPSFMGPVDGAAAVFEAHS